MTTNRDLSPTTDAGHKFLELYAEPVVTNTYLKVAHPRALRRHARFACAPLSRPDRCLAAEAARHLRFGHRARTGNEL